MLLQITADIPPNNSNYQHHSINYWVENVFQAPSDQLLSLSAMSSWARRELSLHLAALTFSHFRGLLPIIRFEDFLSAPLLMCNSQVCLEGCFHVAAAQWKKKKREREKPSENHLGEISEQWQQWPCRSNIYMNHRNGFTGRDERGNKCKKKKSWFVFVVPWKEDWLSLIKKINDSCIFITWFFSWWWGANNQEDT